MNKFGRGKDNGLSLSVSLRATTRDRPYSREKNELMTEYTIYRECEAAVSIIMNINIIFNIRKNTLKVSENRNLLKIKANANYLFLFFPEYVNMPKTLLSGNKPKHLIQDC